MCKKHLLLIVLSLAPYYANAQQLDTVFIGMATLQDKTTLTYKLKFTDSAGTIKGYSVTDIAGNDETTASISGSINPSKTQIQFKELNITNTKSKGAQSDFCIMQGALKVKKINGVKVLKGHFEGYLNGSTTLCASGKLILISPKDFLKVIGKAQHEEEDSSELHSKENVNSRRNKNKAKTKEDAPTETALVNEETLKPKVEIVKKEPKLNSTIVYEDAPKQVSKVQPGKTIEFNCATQNVKLEIWDNMTIDGDIVSLMQGNRALVKNYTLTGTHHEVMVDLGNKLVDTLQLIAISEGSEPLNTARIKITSGNDFYFLDATTTIDKDVLIVLRRNRK